MNIIIIDGNASDTEFIAKKIRSWGYKAVVIENRNNSLEDVKEIKADLVMFNLCFPKKKSYSIISQCKELWSQAGIIVMTDNPSRELEVEIRKQGVLYYLIKPFGMEILKEILEHISKSKTG